MIPVKEGHSSQVGRIKRIIYLAKTFWRLKLFLIKKHIFVSGQMRNMCYAAALISVRSENMGSRGMELCVMWRVDLIMFKWVPLSVVCSREWVLLALSTFSVNLTKPHFLWRTCLHQSFPIGCCFGKIGFQFLGYGDSLAEQGL